MESDETFGLIVQQDPSDGASVYLASSDFKIQDNDTLSYKPEEIEKAFLENLGLATGLTASYQSLLDGVPNKSGYISLINSAIASNFGAGAGVVFNEENIFINLLNNLVHGNTVAAAKFATLSAGATLVEKITSIYCASSSKLDI